MKLALGTVQFGLNYGAFNPGGQVSEADVAAILDAAGSLGVDLLDTAHAYGQSEAVLGRLGAAQHFHIVTKTPPLAGESNPAGALERALTESLMRLKVGMVYGLMLHRVSDLLGDHGDALWAVLEQVQRDGRAGRIGVSVYDPEELEQVLDRYPISLVQVPFNALDQRFMTSGVLARARAQGVEVHARSLFLQGFLLSTPDQLTPYLQRYASVLTMFRAACAHSGLSPLAGALAAASAQPCLDYGVVGVTTAQQLCDIAQALAAKAAVSLTIEPVSDVGLINPAHWQV